MGILTRSLIRAFSLEDPSQPLLPASALFESLGMGRSDAGVLVNEKQALRVTTALACIKIVSEDLATTAHEILQEMSDGSRRVAKDHKLWPLLHDRPHPNMSASDFWAAFLACMLAWGNGYALIQRDGLRRVQKLVVLDPGRTNVAKGSNGELIYHTSQTVTGAVEPLDPSEVLHIKYVTLDGIHGISPIKHCMNAFGLALAAEKFGAQFFGQGARATGVFEHPETLEGEAFENLKKSLYERMTGDQALRPLILEEGMTWKQLTIPPNEAQFLQTRQFQDVNIARLYRVAMHLLQDLQRATNNNIEHQSLDHVKHCLRPNAVKIEEEVNHKLLGGSASPFTMEHNLKDMQRGDFSSQVAGIQTLRNIGYYHINDIARELRQNPIPEAEGGNLRVVQGAFVNLTALLPGGNEVAAPPAPASEDIPDATEPFNRLHLTFATILGDVVGRVARAGTKPDFAMKLLRPVATAMVQAVLTIKFGECALSQKELAAISAEAVLRARECGTWTVKDSTAIAARLAREMLVSLGKEILV